MKSVVNRIRYGLAITIKKNGLIDVNEAFNIVNTEYLNIG